MEITWKGPIHFVKSHGTVEFPKKSGIYLIVEKTPSKMIVRYVGQAKSIYERIQAHKKISEPNTRLRKFIQANMYGSVRIYYTMAHDPIRINNLEFTVFQSYGGLKSLYNEKIPQGDFIKNINYPV